MDSQLAQLRSWVVQARKYSSDSRHCSERDVFVALKGEAVDGHDFVEQVLKKNIVGAVVRQGFSQQTGLVDARLLEVEDTHKAHRFLAQEFRRKFQGKVVAVGGSSGKTSTKEFLFQLLSQKYKTIKTISSQNGELGIPKTLEQLEAGVEVAVVEVGIDAPGDMARHAELVQPDISLLTSIGEEHLNLLKSVENVFLEEKILFDVTLSRGGECFAPSADAYLSRLQKTARVYLIDTHTNQHDSVGMDYSHLPNAIARQNARLAVAVARHLKMSEMELQAAVKILKLPDGRGLNIELKNHAGLLIADHYNSNPSSLRAALTNAQELSEQRKIPLHLYLGDMLDLGQQTLSMHQGLLKEFSSLRAELVFFVGPTWKSLSSEIQAVMPNSSLYFFDDSSQAAQKITTVKQWNTPAVRLVKGSRGIQMENLLKVLQESLS